MSQHHVRSQHVKHAAGIRVKLAATLPAPCLECGRPVLPSQAWHVAHIVPAAQGGRTTLENCRPAHARCNLAGGGRMGAAIVNGRRRAELDAGDGIRRW